MAYGEEGSMRMRPSQSQAHELKPRIDLFAYHREIEPVAIRYPPQ